MSGQSDDAAMNGDVLVPEQIAPLMDPAIPDPSEGEARGPEEGPRALAVIRSKVQAPVLRDPILERPRLLGWLDQHASERVVLVSAEVGYGKSTLLADFSRRADARALWYRLESTDRDWMSFISHLVAAAREAQPDFGAATEALLRHVAAVGPSREMVLSSLLAELGDLLPTRTFVIFDDFHFVDDSVDVRAIVRRLIESAPQHWHFFIAARRRPNLPLGWLAAGGQLGELTTTDLRFTRTELDDLFGTTYAQHLSPESLDIVEERTEGWAASLQLVAASIAASRPSQVEAFIGALSGAAGPIYDFLAEEVLERLSPMTQRVLIHASLLDRVTPVLATAALSATDQPLSVEDVTVCLRDAESLGLFSSRQESPTNGRFHPLLKEFLTHQLKRENPDHQLAIMQVAVAQAAEETDWLVAARHYALASRTEDAMRVLGTAAHQALGTGAWGAAAEIIALMPDTSPPPAVEVIRARAMIAEGRPADALSILDILERSGLDETERALVSLARASALQTLGRTTELWDEVVRLTEMREASAVVKRIARAWHLILSAFRGDSVADARSALRDLVAQTSTAGLRYFAGVALHNEATAALVQGDYDQAYRLSKLARIELLASPTDAEIGPSSIMTQAIAACELGRVDEGLSLAREATAQKNPHPDVLADAVYIAAITGDTDYANVVEHRLARVMAEGPLQVGARSQARYARITNLIVEGEYMEALTHADELLYGPNEEMDSVSRSSYLQATLATLVGRPSAPSDAARSLVLAESQGAWRWETRIRVVDAAARGDSAALRRWVAEASVLSHLALLELAEVLTASLDLLHPAPEELAMSIRKYPARWLPVLSRELDSGRPSGNVAAKLISDYGSLDHASRLVAFERRVGGGPRKLVLSRSLIHRVSPTLQVHDLGRTAYEMAGRKLRSSDRRRKAASLLLFLVTRVNQTATREEIMEVLWPNQAPSSAVNSLHQTLHFVRRDISPWHEDSIAAEYVPMQSELVFLDPELVQIDSVSFLRQATDAVRRGDLTNSGSGLMRLYTGRFAPEFEYEDWAEDWRTLLHTTYLHLAHATATALVSSGRSQQAVGVLARAIEVDAQAFELQVSLIRLFNGLGARDAAVEQYGHYSALVRRELDITAPPFDQLVDPEERPA